MFRQKKPIRLAKKEKRADIIKKKIEDILVILKMPEFWIFLIFGIMFVLLIAFAISESVSYFVYNNGLVGI